MLHIPKARALCQRVRRPTLNVLLGLALIAPAGAMVRFPEQQQPAPAAPGPVDARRQITRKQAVEAVSSALRQQYVDRDRAARSARFAVRFRIPSRLADDIYWAATRERIDPHMAFRLVSVESAFRPSAVSSKGAVGLTQVMPSTARWLFPDSREEDLLVTRYNLRVGFRYLRKLIDTYDDTRLALLAYNRGPGTVDMLVQAGLDPENGYSDLVLTGDRTRLQQYLESRRQAAASASIGERRGS
jgi:soluble lytic murein transglycosylase-like protein